MPANTVRPLFEKLRWILCCLAGTAFAACTPPTGWPQWHADGPSVGFQQVRTKANLEPLWKAPAADAAMGCPVVDSSGFLYTAGTDGVVRKFSPAGKLVAALAVPGKFLAAPAVDDDGRIYVIGMEKDDHDRYFESSECTLYCIDLFQSLLFVRWTHRFPKRGQTLAAPKVVGSGASARVFVLMRFGHYGSALYGVGGSRLYVIDGFGEEVGGLFRLGLPLPCREPHTSVNFNLEFFLTFLFGPIFGTSIYHGTHRPDTNPQSTEYLEPSVYFSDNPRRWPDATPAVQITPDGKAIVVVADNFCAIQAWQYDPTVAWWTTSPWTQLWWEDDPGDAAYSSPAISKNGIVAVGTSSGNVWFYDLLTGVRLYECHTGEEMLGTPAFYPGTDLYTFANSKDHLYQITSSGVITNEVALKSRRRLTSSPAVSLDRVYLAAADGFHSFSIDLSSDIVDTTAPGSSSSASIGPQGRVHMVDANGILHTYKRFDE